MAKTIKGLATNTKRESPKAGKKIDPTGPTTSFVPRAMKKMVKKKSRKPRVLAAMVRCSGRLERARPARKPPTSNVKPRGPATKLAKPRAQAILAIKRSSSERAINFSKIMGKIFLDKNQTESKSAPPLKTMAK